MTQTSQPLKIVLLGAGNVAWHLALALEQAGHRVQTIYNRHLHKAQELAVQLQQAEATTASDFSKLKADVFILTVADQALPEVLQQAVFPEGSLVVHTSGSHDLSVFSEKQLINGGVFYPLQTFSKSKPVDFKNVPVCIEAARETDKQLLQQLAQSISNKVAYVTSAERRVLHVAAVFACNFTNHLLGISHDILERSHLDATLLHPLIQETVDKATHFPPFSVQTGPAARGDENIIHKHLQMLQDEPVYRQLYYLLSESIHRTQQKQQDKQ
ncbi:MAG: DUF2520 domain-containing protein [Hymenobacteraceae bacterium]|nr:DUF2520 domain-containing protein [Hymenobacteraceae bacterium]MDX5396459.1 DUF2520 domain-containing protein [Hymenobacteraceae bacterium]MDX5512520.1 DUF2520 domain-containing protein [Hymenobacteraceae bacterium]